MSAVEDVTAKVQRILTATFGSVKVNAKGVFGIEHGSTAVAVRVAPFMDDKAVVHVFSVVLHGMALTPELYKWVATEGQMPMFGSFAVVEGQDPKIVLNHYLLGDYLDAEELKNAVMFLAVLADDRDDKLQAMFGGKKLKD